MAETVDDIPSQDLLWMYQKMVTSRAYEEFMREAYLEGKTPVFNMAEGPIPGEMHLSNGQEPCAVGVCVHLRPDDCVMAPHRPNHIAVAKGVDLEKMTAEIFGRANGLSRGKGGHMHLFDPAVNFGCSGIVAQALGPALGQALAFKMRGKDSVAVAYIGEGGANQGLFHESLNLAALWQLPFICVIEDNQWGVSVSKKKSTAVARNSDRASGYGLPGEYVENNDPLQVYRVAKRAVERARSGEGASLIEIQTHRLAGHFVGDPEFYLPEADKDNRSDPIPLMRQLLMDLDLLTEAEAKSMDEQAGQQMLELDRYARNCPEPKPEEALANVYA